MNKIVPYSMKKIPLTQGQVALVDDQDFKYLNQFKWYASFSKCTNSFYAHRTARINANKKEFCMHRVIMNVTDRNILVDHENHDTLNNQRYNLRVATRAQNQANKTAKKIGASKFLGVSRINRNNPWRATIVKDYKQTYLGVFKNEIDAALAYNEAAKRIHGEFANLNKIAV